MFRNLEAEQKRRGLTDAQVSEKLGISRNTYGIKKKTGSFSRHEIVLLLEMFKSKFEYLFDTDDNDKAS